MALRDEHKPDEAIVELRRAIELDPRLGGAHNNLGLALDDQEKLEEAAVEYGRAIELDPRGAAPHNNLGFVLNRQHKLDEAIAEIPPRHRARPARCRRPQCAGQCAL